MEREIKEFAKGTRNKSILEIGSGKTSMEKYFDSSNHFVKSDIEDYPDVDYIDVMAMDLKEKFDIILCLSVLEHIPDFSSAVKNIFFALKKNGVLVLFVPFIFPLHSEPSDYWRFSEHGIMKMLNGYFEITKLKRNGIRKIPFTYYAECIKMEGLKIRENTIMEDE